MTRKFICIGTEPYSIPLGTILEGVVTHNGARFTTTKDSELKAIYGPRFEKGCDLPMEGNLWQWKEVVKPTRNIIRGIKRKAKRNH